MRRHAIVFGSTLAIVTLSLNGAFGQDSTPPKPVENTAKQPKNEAVAKLLQTQVEAAQTCYRDMVNGMAVERAAGFLVFKDEEPTRPVQVYTWSVRWMEAQRSLSATKDGRIAALTAHQQRMKDLQATVKVLVAANRPFATRGMVRDSEVSACEWYLAEVELLLLREREK